MFQTWSYESERPFSLELLRQMVRRELPASIYRCKGIVYAADFPSKRYALQIVGRRTEIYELDEDQRTFETPPRTRTGRRCLATNTNARPLPGRASDRPSWLWNDTPKGLPCPYFERLPLPYRLLLRMKIQRPHSARAETATSE